MSDGTTQKQGQAPQYYSDGRSLLSDMANALRAILEDRSTSDDKIVSVLQKYDDYIGTRESREGFVVIEVTDEECKIEMAISEQNLMQAFITFIQSDVPFRRACFVAVSEYITSNLNTVTGASLEALNGES